MLESHASMSASEDGTSYMRREAWYGLGLPGDGPSHASLHAMAGCSKRSDLTASWTSTGVQEYRGIRRYLTAAADTATSRLQASGWSVEVKRVDAASLHIEAHLDLRNAYQRLQQLAEGLDHSLLGLRFSE